MTINAKSVLAMIDEAQNAGQRAVILALANLPEATTAKQLADSLWDMASTANKVLGNGKALSSNELHTMAAAEGE